MSESTESVFYSLKAERPGGGFYNFADLKGKTVLIVNVASKWYVTTMHAGIRMLKEKIKVVSRSSTKVLIFYLFQTDWRPTRTS